MPKMTIPDFSTLKNLPTYGLLLKDEGYFKAAAEEFLKSCKGKPEEVHKVSINLICDGGKNESEIKKSMNQIKQIIKKIKTLDSVSESDKKYFEKLFSLFMADHEFHLCILQKKWKDAKKQCQYLLDESPKFTTYYSCFTPILNGCVVMEMIEKGESEESIRKTKEFKDILSFRDGFEDAYGKYFPEIIGLLGKE